MNQNLLFIGAPTAGIDSLSLMENDDNSDFGLIIEVSFEFGDMADFMTQLFQRYHYRHIAFIRDDALGYFNLLSIGILRRLKTSDEDLYNSCSELPFNSAKATTDDYRKLLIDADGRARGKTVGTFRTCVLEVSCRLVAISLKNGFFSEFCSDCTVHARAGPSRDDGNWTVGFYIEAWASTYANDELISPPISNQLKSNITMHRSYQSSRTFTFHFHHITVPQMYEYVQYKRNISILWEYLFLFIWYIPCT